MRCAQLPALAAYIPTGAPRLESAVYELVLDQLLVASPSTFLETLRSWGGGRAGLYSLPVMLKRIDDRLLDDTKQNPALVEAKGLLLSLARHYDKALACYLELDAATCSDVQGVFGLIEDHALYLAVKGRVKRLIGLDRKMAGDLLCKVTDEISIHSVVDQLSGSPELTLWYLHTLFDRQLEVYQDSSFANLHMRQVALYAQVGAAAQLQGEEAEDAPDSRKESPMIRFLRWSAHRPSIALAAYDVCSQCKPPLWDEMVYLLQEQQRSIEALRILLTQVGDVRRAIGFIESEKDSALTKELWDDLIVFSLEHPAFLTGVLDYAGLSAIELPSRLIKEIPAQMEIHDLRQKLVKIIDDYRFQRSLHQSCRDAMETWFHHERAKLYQMQRRGRRAVPSGLGDGDIQFIDHRVAAGRPPKASIRR